MSKELMKKIEEIKSNATIATSSDIEVFSKKDFSKVEIDDGLKAIVKNLYSF
jgi:hypothetical protein